MTWINAIIQGILLGGLYALFACGLSLMFGVMRIINLAHGDLALLGTFMVLVISQHVGLSPFASLLIVLPGAALVGYALYYLMFDRSMRGGELSPLLATFGLSVVIGNVLLEVFSADTHSLTQRLAGTFTPTEELYREGPNSQEFPRTASRLIEMRTREYMASPHHAGEGPTATPS